VAVAMIIEFLGNSGAGKTTLIPILVQFLRDDGLIAMPVTEAVHHYVRNTRLGQMIKFLIPQALQGPALWRAFSYIICPLHIAKFTAKHTRLVRYVAMSQLGRRIPWQHRRLILRLFFQMIGTYSFLKSQAQPAEILVCV
jgi:ABC-type transporter Mla maintaining outer membrane lipid asymmetry ATPase subunit MlaF